MPENVTADYRPWLHRYAVFMACSTLLLIVAGALVTSNDAGLSVPDWPLSYGTWMPPMVGGIFYEHGHRMIAATVGFLTIILAVWLWRTEERRWMHRLGFIALAAVIVQGILGGLTVIYLLPWPISVGHASLAQSFFCLTVALALFTSRSWQQAPPRTSDEDALPLPRLALFTAIAVFIQLVLGAALRHHAIGVLPHLLWAAAVAVLAGWTAKRALTRRQLPALRVPAIALAGLVVLQLGLGVTAYLGRLAAETVLQPVPWIVGVAVAHVATGALVLAACVLLTLQAYRRLEPGRAAAQLAATTGKTY